MQPVRAQCTKCGRVHTVQTGAAITRGLPERVRLRQLVSPCCNAKMRRYSRPRAQFQLVSSNLSPEPELSPPAPPGDLGKRIAFTYPPSSRATSGEVVGEIVRRQSDDPRRLTCMQLLQLDGGTRVLRIGYYVAGSGPDAPGHWEPGQFAIVPIPGFAALVTEAHMGGWF